MRLRAAMLCAVALAMSQAALAQPQFFGSSLHATRAGKEFWYGAQNGGFELFTNVPISELGCVECHGPTDASGNPYPDPYTPGCGDCHDGAPGPGNTDSAQCLSCHGRQNAESNFYTDYHRDVLEFDCWDCHGTGDLHGDGTPYESMLMPGAVDADCTDCHTTPEPGHEMYDPHDGAIHCIACHAQSVISCYNCHFESQVESHVKRANRQIKDFVMLVNRTEDNKVYTATFQSLTYQGDSFVAYGPYTPHTITGTGRSCGECHNNFSGTNVTINDYNADRQIDFATWDDGTNTLSWHQGVVPMPYDFADTFKMDFITYTGNTSDPPGPSPLWDPIGENTPDGYQMFFATPLTLDQMDAIGFDVSCPGDFDGSGDVGFADLLVLLGQWGPCVGCLGDLDQNGDVAFADLLILLGSWGSCPP